MKADKQRVDKNKELRDKMSHPDLEAKYGSHVDRLGGCSGVKHDQDKPQALEEGCTCVPRRWVTVTVGEDQPKYGHWWLDPDPCCPVHEGRDYEPTLDKPQDKEDVATCTFRTKPNGEIVEGSFKELDPDTGKPQDKALRPGVSGQRGGDTNPAPGLGV